MHHLEIDRVVSSYGDQTILRGVTLSVDKGEVLTLIGPSGSGKSTLLRVLIGLTPPTSGAVRVAGEKIEYGRKPSLRALRDRVAIVFQQYNLFQNMTALRNVTIAPIKIKKEAADVVEERAVQLLGRVGLADKLDAYPDELSGGQQQRVAIARALALQPEILLLDEVTSALDPERVGEVLDTIRTLTGQGMTMVIVSHEMAFVREVSTRVAMMDDGQIVECAAPEVIFDNPREERTKAFVSRILKH